MLCRQSDYTRVFFFHEPTTTVIDTSRHTLSRPDTLPVLRIAVHSALCRNAGIDCRVVLVPPRSLPFTTSGKLSRAKAKQAYLEGFYDESKTQIGRAPV